MSLRSSFDGSYDDSCDDQKEECAGLMRWLSGLVFATRKM